MTTKRRGRLAKLATLSSQALNVLAFNGSPDETICGRAYREGTLGGDPVWERRRRILDRVIGAGHCGRSHELDVDFAWLALGIR